VPALLALAAAGAIPRCFARGPALAGTAATAGLFPSCFRLCTLSAAAGLLGLLLLPLWLCLLGAWLSFLLLILSALLASALLLMLPLL